MWCNHDAESDGMYAVSQTLSALLKDISSNKVNNEFFRKVLLKEINGVLQQFGSLSHEESEVILCLLPGGEGNVITAGDTAISSSGDYVTILGFTDCWIEPAKIQKMINDESESDLAKKLNKSLSLEFTSEK